MLRGKLKQAAQTRSPLWRWLNLAAVGVVLFAVQYLRAEEFSIEELTSWISYLLALTGLEYGRAKMEG